MEIIKKETQAKQEELAPVSEEFDTRLETGQTTRARKKPQRQDVATWVMDMFYDSGVNENINYANTANRNAAEWLVLKYGLQKVENMVKYAISVQNQPYAPTITTPFQLKEKLAALIKFKLTYKDNKPKIWRKNSTYSQPVEPITRLLRKPPTESSQPTTKTLLN